MISSLALAGMGLLVVFAVLALLALMVHLIRRLDARWQAHEQARDAAAALRPNGAQDRTSEATIDTTTLVIITAAVATVLQGRGRIRRVRVLPPGAPGESVWAMQGRLSVQGSHVITRKKAH